MLTMKSTNVKSGAERVADHVDRLKESGGIRTSVEFSAETLRDIARIKKRAHKGSTKSLVSEAIRRWAAELK